MLFDVPKQFSEESPNDFANFERPNSSRTTKIVTSFSGLKSADHFSAKSPNECRNSTFRNRSRTTKIVTSFVFRDASKFAFLNGGCCKLQNFERHAGREAKKTLARA